MSLLLTGGRLSANSKKIIEDEYEKELKRYGDVGRATRAAQQLFAVTPEFHSTGANDVAIEPEMREIVQEEAAGLKRRASRGSSGLPRVPRGCRN